MGYKRVTQEQYDDYFRLKAAEDRQIAAITERFRIKSQCSSCGYQSLDLTPGNACPHWDCNGGMRDY